MKTTLLLASLLTAFILPASGATTIYQDDFSGAPTDGLNGRSTDIGGGIWAANPEIKANGDMLTQGNRAAFLPFSPQSGFIYTASIGMDFANAVSGTGSLQFGFTNGADVSDAPTNYLSISGHAFIRQDGSAASRRSQNSTIASVGLGTFNDGTPDVDVVTLTLDTTGANWTFQAAINGGNIGSLHTFTPNPTINNIVFGTNNVAGATGSFSDFSLTSVPEPSALLFSFVGGVLVLFRRRR